MKPSPSARASDTPPQAVLLCPSADPGMPNAKIFGVVNGSVSEPRVSYLHGTIDVKAASALLPPSVSPKEVFRISAPCVARRCIHFDSSHCRLASRVVSLVSVTVDILPRCGIRRSCLWYQQEGKAACERCPSIVTEDYSPSEQLRHAAGAQ
jgi:hypothetical protein